MRLLKLSASAAMVVGAIMFVPGCSRAPKQATFATPDDAAKALLEAIKADDMSKLRAIFGREALQASASGDSVADRYDREVVALAMQQSWHWAASGADRKELIIGEEQWPFPAPLVKKGAEWQFDSEAGKTEVRAR